MSQRYKLYKICCCIKGPDKEQKVQAQGNLHETLDTGKQRSAFTAFEKEWETSKNSETSWEITKDLRVKREIKQDKKKG